MKSIGLWSTCAAVTLAGCAASDSAGFADGRAPGDGTGSPVPEVAPPGEETEVESLYEAPVSTGHSIWVANPTSGRVAYIDAETLAVTTLEAGNGPSHLAGIVGRTGDAVIVQNALSNDATLIERTDAGAVVTTYPIATHANSWAVAPSGHCAVAWADARLEPDAPSTEGFQELTVLDTAPGGTTSTILAVDTGLWRSGSTRPRVVRTRSPRMGSSPSISIRGSRPCAPTYRWATIHSAKTR